VDKILEVVSNVSTPLALAGIILCFMFYIIRQIFSKITLPKPTNVGAFETIKLFVDRFFYLSLIAIFLGFAGYVIKLLWVDSPKNTREAVKAIELLKLSPTPSSIQSRAIPTPDDVTTNKQMSSFSNPTSSLPTLAESKPSIEPTKSIPKNEISIPISNGIEITFVYIPAGEFMMGSPEDENDRLDNEGLQYRVTISKPFYMGKYEVTQAQWESLMGANPSQFRGNPNHPVECVSWDECQKFIKKFNKLTLRSFRLPTEAEWEYACRAGSEKRFYWGEDPDYSQIKDYAWYYGNNEPSGTKEVGLKKSNKFGLYDMSGNVWEWCEDEWHDYYAGAPEDGSAWITNYNNSVSLRVIRGGCWSNGPWSCRSANRFWYFPDDRYVNLGFRLVSSRN
jgi:formylglycine-generating enzyme required for sulfatase activity